VEAVIIQFFLKNWRSTIVISGIVNIFSTIVGLLFLFFSPIPFFRGEGAFFMYILNGVQLLIEEGEEYLFFTIFELIIVCIVTILIEVGMSIYLSPPPPKKQILKIMTLSNIISYVILLLSTIAIGVWFTLTYPNQTIDIKNFFEGKLFQVQPMDELPSLFPQLFILIILLVILMIFYKKFDPLRLKLAEKE
jgi:ABC-type Mn2+/Zn2+ transport system permease subunit